MGEGGLELEFHALSHILDYYMSCGSNWMELL